MSDSKNLSHFSMAEKADRLCAALTSTLAAHELFQRRFFPLELEPLREELRPCAALLDDARQAFRQGTAEGVLLEKGEELAGAASLAAQALEIIFSAPLDPLQMAVMRTMQARRKSCCASEILFHLRHIFPLRLRPFFLEAAVHHRMDELDPPVPLRSDSGWHFFTKDDQRYGRGASTLYIPESYDGSRAWPLVVALHGGFGHGRDYIWTLLREARSRRFLLLAPTSGGDTWSLHHPPDDVISLGGLVDHVTEQYHVDTSRILLTGISDGGTFALLCCCLRYVKSERRLAWIFCAACYMHQYLCHCNSPSRFLSRYGQYPDHSTLGLGIIIYD